MKVLIFHSASLNGFPSGEENVAIREFENLEKIGVEVRLCVYGPTVSRGPMQVWIKMCSAFTLIWSRRAYRFVSDEIDKFKPNLVHFHGITPFLSPSALKAAHDKNIGVIQTLHNGRWLCVEGGFYRSQRFCNKCVGTFGLAGLLYGCKQGRLVSFLFYMANRVALRGGRLFRWVDRFIAVSDFIKDQHIMTGFPEKRISVKCNGMDLGALTKTRKMVSEKSGVVFVGRFSSAKGIRLLKLMIERLTVPFKLVGDGPDFPSLKAFCENSGFSHVTFLGRRTSSECLKVMADSLVTLVPSQCGEAFPLVAVESMGVGTAVVGTDVGGLGPLIHKSCGGVAVNPEDDDGFLEATSKLVKEPEQARAIGKRGLRYVEKYLGASKNTQELVAIYNSAFKEAAINVKNI